MKFSSTEKSSSFFSFKTTLIVIRQTSSVTLKPKEQKYCRFYNMAKKMSFLRHGISDSQTESTHYWQRRQTRNSAGYLTCFCRNIYNQFKLQSYKDITYDAFAIHITSHHQLSQRNIYY